MARQVVRIQVKRKKKNIIPLIEQKISCLFIAIIILFSCLFFFFMGRFLSLFFLFFFGGKCIFIDMFPIDFVGYVDFGY